MSLHRRRSPVHRWRLLWPAAPLLAVMWMLLWGAFTWGNLVGGLLVAAVVLLVLPMPPVAVRGPLRPWRLLVLLARFHWDLLRASLQVSVLVFRFGHVPRGAIIGVRLRSTDDLVITVVAELSSLVPGTLVVDAHRITGTLYLHVLDVEVSGGLDAVRRETLDLEARVLRALAPRDELVELGLVAEQPRRAPVAAGTGRGEQER